MKNNYQNIVNPKQRYYKVGIDYNGDPTFYLDTVNIFYSFYLKYFQWEKDEVYWYCCLNFDTLPNRNFFKEILSEDLLTQAKNKKLKIVCAVEFESWLAPINAIYDYLICECGVPEDQIIFLSENWNAYITVNKIAENTKKEKIQVFFANMFSNYVVTAFQQHSRLPNTLTKKNYKKYFLCFNQRARAHRLLLIALLTLKKLLDKGFISYEIDWNKDFDLLLNEIQKNSELVEYLNKNKSEITVNRNSYLDSTKLDSTKDLMMYTADNYSNTLQLYEDSLLSLVTETRFFEENTLFFSEKIYKPILYKHPFIIVSNPFYLKGLKKLGFKTFDPYINEQYDDEPDPIKRMLMIVDEIERISSFNQEQVDAFIEGVQEIAEYNHSHLLRLSPTIIRTL